MIRNDHQYQVSLEQIRRLEAEIPPCETGFPAAPREVVVGHRKGIMSLVADLRRDVRDYQRRKWFSGWKHRWRRALAAGALAPPSLVGQASLRAGFLQKLGDRIDRIFVATLVRLFVEALVLGAVIGLHYAIEELGKRSQQQDKWYFVYTLDGLTFLMLMWVLGVATFEVIGAILYAIKGAWRAMRAVLHGPK